MGWRRINAGVSRSGCYLCAVALAIGLCAPVCAQEVEDPVDTEYRVKAAFIYNFLRFTEWRTARSHSDPSDTIRVGVFGDQKSYPYLREMEKRDLDGHRIRVLPVKTHDALVDCHVVFFPGDAYKDDAVRMNELANRGILLIGEGYDFLKQGGLIGFYRKAHQVGFAVNLKACRRSSLRISSRLLEVADVYRDEEDRP